MWFLRRRQNKATEEADAALKEAQENLAKTERRGGEVNRIVSAFREIREHNHLAEQMEDIILRHGKGK